jgi:hypothetical protein
MSNSLNKPLHNSIDIKFKLYFSDSLIIDSNLTTNAKALNGLPSNEYMKLANLCSQIWDELHNEK